MIVWDAKMETGIATVDRQHQELVRQVNELVAAMQKGKGREVVGDVLVFLGKYAVEHFGTEEALMRQHGYPDYEKHRAIHESFKADFGRLAAEMDANPTRLALTIEVQRRVMDWLRDHILNVDTRFGAFMAAKAAA